MVKVGEHIALDFLGIKHNYTSKFFGKIIYKIAKAAEVEILNISQHKFKPQGFTLVALLAESHMSFHTFPEKNIIILYTIVDNNLAKYMASKAKKIIFLVLRFWVI